MNISDLLLNVISSFYENDNRARSFGTDQELYHSEIHMLDCIAGHPSLHISGIARVLGVTRGAASQTAKRLEKKGMVVKQVCSENVKMTILELTEKGETAVLNHIKAHEQYGEIVQKILIGAKEENIQFLEEFLQSFENELKNRY